MTKYPIQQQETYPYFIKQISCPVCGSQNVHHYLKDNQYIVQQKDIDQYPLKYDWYNPRYKKYNPLYFFLFYCNNCHFADERFSYMNPYKYNDHQKFSILKTIHKERYLSDETIDFLSQYISYPEMDYTSAINLHLLALYIQMGPSDSRYQDEEKIARFAHRLGWLFRENVYVGAYSEEEEIINQFTMMYENYQSSFLQTLASFERLKEWWADRLKKEEAGEEKSVLSTFELDLLKGEKEISRLLDHLLLQNPGLYEIITKFREKYVQTSRLVLNEPFHEYTSYFAFLQQLKQLWPLAPVDEISALNLAAEYYKKLLKKDTFTGETIKLYKTFELIMALYQKMNLSREELEMLEQAYSHAFEFRQKAKERLKKLQMQKDEDSIQLMSGIKSTIRRMDELLLKWKERRSVLQNSLRELERQRAEKILNSLDPELSVKEKIQFLEQQGIDPIVIDEIKEKLEPPSEGFFRKIFK